MKRIFASLALALALTGVVATSGARADDTGTCEGTPPTYGHEWQGQSRTRDLIPAVEEVKRKEWRFQTRTPLFGSKEVKEVKGFDFVDGGSVRVNGQTISGHWVASSGWHVIPDSIINAVWGEPGVPEQYLGTGRVSLSSYGGPSVTVDYKAHKVTTSEDFTEWGPWSDWSTTNPGGDAETRNVDSRWVVTVEAVPAHYTAWSEWADTGDVVRTDEQTEPETPAEADVIEHRWAYVGTYVKVEATDPTWQDTDPEAPCFNGPERPEDDYFKDQGEYMTCEGLFSWVELFEVPYVWDGDAWVPGEPVSLEHLEDKVRDLTLQERFEQGCVPDRPEEPRNPEPTPVPDPTPTPTDPPTEEPTPERDPTDELAETGVDAGVLGVIAAALVAAGGGLIFRNYRLTKE